MADTGEDREITQRANAHQKEVVREMKKLVQTAMDSACECYRIIQQYNSELGLK